MTSDRLELARIELEIAEDIERVTAAEIIRWLQARQEHDAIALVERAAAAIGRAKRLREEAANRLANLPG